MGWNRDETAIHDDVAGEIAAITEKVSPVGADKIVGEDSAAGNAKVMMQIGNLPGGGGGGGGGGTAVIEGFGEDNLAASLTNSQLYRNVQGIETQLPVVISRNGSIIGLSVASSEARTAGTATFEVFKNGLATGLTAVLNATDTQYAFTVQAASLDTFFAGDRLDVRVTTDGSWAPTTADVEAVITTQDGVLVVPQWVNYLAARQSDETPDADDDFFDDGTLDSAWVELKTSGDQTITEKYGLLSIEVTGAIAINDFNALLRPITPSVGDVIETHIHSTHVTTAGTDFLFAGLVWSDGTAAGSNIGLLGAQRDNATGRWGWNIASRDGTFTLAATGSVVQAINHPGHGVYLRLEYDAANTFRVFVSNDGVTWIDYGTEASILTPTHVGLVWTIWGDSVADQVVAFDYFRYNGV